MIRLTKEELMPHTIDAKIMGIDDDGMLGALNLVAQAQLKKVVGWMKGYQLTFHQFPNTQRPLLKGTIVIKPEVFIALLKECEE